MQYLDLLREQFEHGVSFREKRPGIQQLVAPFFHEDGDMADIFLEAAPGNAEAVRVCDHGLTLMRLSYAFDYDGPETQDLLRRILAENRAKEDDGNLYLEVAPSGLFEGVLRFTRIVAQVVGLSRQARANGGRL